MKGLYLLTIILVFLMCVNFTSAHKESKVLVIGFDGADWDIIDPLLKDKKLPNIEKVIEGGDRSNLESTKPSMSPVAWTTFATGKTPGKHNIYSFLERKDKNFIPLTSEDIKSKKLWDITSENNLTYIVMNVPMTYPPHKIKGNLISGYLSIEDTTYTHPKSLQEDLEKMGYKIEALSEGFEPGKEDEFLKDLNYTVDKRTEAIKYLMDKTDWNLSVVIYTGLDRLQHYFWKYMDEEGSRYEETIPQHYIKLDEQIGKLLEEVDDSTRIIVLSDHGFGKLKGEVYINHWLREEGYLKMKDGGNFLNKLGITQQRLIAFLKEMHLFEPLKWVLKQMNIYKVGKSLPHPEMEDIDMNKTDAFAANFGGGIYITADNYEKIKNEVKSKLEDLKNPKTGEKFFSEVADTDVIYPNKVSNSAPDLIVDSPDWDPVGYLGYGKLYSTGIDKSGKHRNTGILITSFPIVKNNNSLKDIAPTIVDLFDLKTDEEFDGKSLIE